MILVLCNPLFSSFFMKGCPSKYPRHSTATLSKKKTDIMNLHHFYHHGFETLMILMTLVSFCFFLIFFFFFFLMVFKSFHSFYFSLFFCFLIFQIQTKKQPKTKLILPVPKRSHFQRQNQNGGITRCSLIQGLL